MRKTVNEKVKGAAAFFVTDIDPEPSPGTPPVPEPNPEPDKQPLPKPDKDPEMQPEPGKETPPDADKVTGTQTDTDTLLQQMLKPSDNYVRKVYYPLDYQEQFIKKMAKKYKRTESEIVRMALDYFIKNGKI